MQIFNMLNILFIVGGVLITKNKLEIILFKYTLEFKQLYLIFQKA